MEFLDVVLAAGYALAGALGGFVVGWGFGWIQGPAGRAPVSVAPVPPVVVGEAAVGAPRVLRPPMVDRAALAALAERVATIEADIALRQAPGVASLDGLVAELVSYRRSVEGVADQIAAIGKRLASVEARAEAASPDAVLARVDVSLEAALGRIGALQGAAERAVDARIAPLFSRLEAVEADRKALMRTVNLEPMRAFATLQVEVDALSERIAALSAVRDGAAVLPPEGLPMAALRDPRGMA